VIVFSFIGVQSSNATSLHDAIRAAWEIDPTRQSLSVDSHAARRTAEAERSWFPGGPILSGQYYDDHAVGSNQGYTTYQVGIAVPLWLPGERSARVKTEMASRSVAETHLQMERMSLAVQVLDLATTASIAGVTARSVEQEHQALTEVDATSRRLLAAGEISTADRDAVRSELEDLESQLTNTQEKLSDAQAGLRELTGGDDVPDMSAIDGRSLTDAHLQSINLAVDHDPRMKFARAGVDAARAEDQLSAHSYMDHPQVGIESIHEKQYGSPWNTRFGVQVSVPLPSEARNVPMRMKAARDIAAAERDEEKTRRMVLAEYARTRARLASSISILKHAKSKREALVSRVDELEKAWKVGELPVIEYLRARRSALESREQEMVAAIAWRSAVARLIIAGGGMP